MIETANGQRGEREKVMGKANGLWLGVVVGCLLGAVAEAQQKAPPSPPVNVEFTADITYATVDGEELKLNLSRPKDVPAKPLPLVLVIHGGGWAAGNRNGHNDLTWKFAQQGYVSAT